ncbi:MAG: hypothetical protein NWP91_02960 [Rickettsiaceae bacterium]|jgi:hypothetical protein|nr:hypothetical protein [Rickettsiaceae bacterium]
MVKNKRKVSMNILGLKKMSKLEKNIIFDRAIIRGAILFVIGVLIFQSINTLYLLTLCTSYTWLEFWCNILFLSKNKPIFVEKMYQGSFDSLVDELYRIGLEMRNKIEERYVFTFKYRLKNESFLIKAHGDTCIIHTNKNCMDLLQSHLPLIEKSNLQDTEGKNAN